MAIGAVITFIFGSTDTEKWAIKSKKLNFNDQSSGLLEKNN
jgi:hypothetical protein